MTAAKLHLYLLEALDKEVVDGVVRCTKCHTEITPRTALLQHLYGGCHTTHKQISQKASSL